MQIDRDTKQTCTAGFDSAGSLRKHEDRVHGAIRFWCDECEKTLENGVPKKMGFTTKAQLSSHIRSAHADCMFCTQKCSSQAELQKHIETRHSGKSVEERKTAHCTFPGCDKSFTKQSNLNVHIRTIHKGERFTCGKVDLRSSIGLAFWDHKGCGNDFASKVNLEDHVRTQHMGLPSLLVAKRKKNQNPAPPKPRKRGKKNQDVVDQLTGAGYGDDEVRNIPCLIRDCEWMFSREYDLVQHLETKHTMSAEEIEAAAENALAGNPQFEPNHAFPNDDRAGMDALYDQAELEWDLQRHAEDGGQFWIGAEEVPNVEPSDQWLQDESEMRRLIGQDVATPLDPTLPQFSEQVDPQLQNL
jgi:general transcription factor IIIA